MTIQNSIGYKYNIEWYLGNGDIMTTSGRLEDIKSGYYYFKYDNGGYFVVECKAIRSLECIE